MDKFLKIHATLVVNLSGESLQKLLLPFIFPGSVPLQPQERKRKILGPIFFDPPLRASLFNKVTIYKTCGELFLLI